MKLGIYGGTFDPVHHGHLILAREARERLGLDRVILVPNARSPFKLAGAPSDGDARWEMVLAAVAGEEGLGADDCELRRGGVSYAVETAEAFRERHPGAELVYLIGEDNVADLALWKRYEDLARIVRFAVLAREGAGEVPGAARVERRVEISATDIRRRVALGRSIRYLVPEAVREIIVARRLYLEEPPSNPNS
jgi:nicotinate-nucleotide adenylyltransferase